MACESKILSANDRCYFGNFEETLSNASVGDLEFFSQTEEAEATLKEVKGELENISEEKFTSLDGNIRFPKDKVITEEGDINYCLYAAMS